MANLNEIGTEGLQQFYGHVSEAYLSKLQWPAAYQVYDEMRRRDPTLRAILNAIRLMARQTKWTVEPTGESDADLAAADFLAGCLDDMSHTVEDFIDDALTMLPFGWASFEICYKKREDARIGWRKFAFRRQSTLSRWGFDEAGGLAGWYQQAAPDYIERFLPIEKLLHFVAERDGGNPEGLSLFEAAYEPYHYVTNLQIISGIGWQRTFVGLPHFHFDDEPNEEDKRVVREAGEGLRQGAKAFVSTPKSVAFELLSAQNSGAESLLNTIRMYRIMMCQLVLADFIWLGTGDSGSWSLGSDKSQLFLMAVNGYLDRIAAIWNRYGVSRLFGYNDFAGLTGLPRIRHTEVRKFKLGELGSFIQQIAAYIPLHESDTVWIRDQAGMNQPSGEILAGTGGGPGGGSTGISLPWQYPEEREPVGASAPHEDAVMLAQGAQADDPDGALKTTAAEELQTAIESYFEGLRKRIVAATLENHAAD